MATENPNRAITISEATQLATKANEYIQKAARRPGVDFNALLAAKEEVRKFRREIPDNHLLIAVDWTGSMNNDRVAVEETLALIKEENPERSILTALFGDYGTDSRLWNGQSLAKEEVIAGGANRHEGALEAVFYLLEQAKIDLTQRNAESNPVHVIVVTDEHVSGKAHWPQKDKMTGMEFPDRPEWDADYSLLYDNIDETPLAVKIKILQDANIRLHFITPEQNTTDYTGSVAIKYLGQICQFIAGLTKGDWHKLGDSKIDTQNMVKVVPQVVADLTRQLASGQQTLTKLLKDISGN